MHVSTVNLSGILKKHMLEKKLSQRKIGELTDLSTFTILNFLKNRKTPHRETCEKIEDYLKNAGVLTRFGFPTEPLLKVEIQPEDNEQLRSMGIRPYTPPSTKPCLTESERRFLIYAFYNANGLRDQKDALIDKILSAFA